MYLWLGHSDLRDKDYVEKYLCPMVGSTYEFSISVR
jgi:hypothetical protein